MPISAAKRQQAEQIVYDVISTLDKTGKNTARYKKLFSSMDNKAFEAYFTAFLSNPKTNFTLEVMPFDSEPTFDQVVKAAKTLNVPLEEYVYYHHETTTDGKPVRSRHRVPVGWIHAKRLQQIVSKKTTYTTSIAKRNALTNQVTHESKVASNSDMETQALLCTENYRVLEELLGARADNKGQKNALYADIARDGFAKLEDMKQQDNIFEKATLNTLDVYIIGSGLKSDIVTDGARLSISLLPE